MSNPYYNPNEYYISDDVSDSISHYGTPHDGSTPHSGRYVYGSGDHPFQRLGGVVGEIYRLQKEGYTHAEIAKAFGDQAIAAGEKNNWSSDRVRAMIQWNKEVTSQKNIARCVEFVDKHPELSQTECARQLGINESSLRNYLKQSQEVRTNTMLSTMDVLKKRLDELGDRAFLDIGKGVSNHMNISEEKLTHAVMMLEEEGYKVIPIDIPTGPHQRTPGKVLVKPSDSDMPRRYVMDNLDKMGEVKQYSEDGGLTFEKISPPVSVSSKRLQIRYDDDPEQSGTLRDGVIELRRGVPELSLGDAHYAQVRIAVDDKYYLKGMAVYADDLPDGIDIRFNSNKNSSVGIDGALKKMKTIKDENGNEVIDVNNPFGASIKKDDSLKLTQRTYTDENGEKHVKAVNIVNEEGNWGEWSRTLASQMLSKQTPGLAKQQLDLEVSRRQRDFDEIMSITNPVLKATLLEDFAGSCDSAAVHLKAASLPRQCTHVILPVPSLKENEIYAPNYNPGEEVVLIRYPHSGLFEIPRLIVNNSNKEAKSMITPNARDAVGIHPNTAAQLSGADFDGDTVLVIPTKGQNIQSRKYLDDLVGFDPKTAYATTKEDRDAGRVFTWKKGNKMHEQKQQVEMGVVSNLISDMQILGDASDEDLAKAVKHSMVIIDAVKHQLDWKRSEKDNDIAELKKKYQQSVNPDGSIHYGGASTLISRASGQKDVPKRKGAARIDPETGEKIWREDPNRFTSVRKPVLDESGNQVVTEYIDSYTGQKKTRKEYYDTGKTKELTTRSTKMAEAKDAYTLTSGGSKANPGTIMEDVYANYANQMKAYANRARKEAMAVPSTPMNPEAKLVYANEIKHLKQEINAAHMNAPKERKAQGIVASWIRLQRQNNPAYSAEDEKKDRNNLLPRAREAVGAKRHPIDISDREWEAIQAGAVTKTDQKEIFRFCDQEQLRQRALPKNRPAMSSADIAYAKRLLAAGYDGNDVAQRLGISTSTLWKNV